MTPLHILTSPSHGGVVMCQEVSNTVNLPSAISAGTAFGITVSESPDSIVKERYLIMARCAQ